MNRRHDPLDPEERELARLLGADEASEPSAALDARILAAARASTHAPVSAAAPLRAGARRRRVRWPAALGLAASVTLAIGVAWQLREPPRPEIASAPASAQDEPAAPVYSQDPADAASAAAEVAPPPPPPPAPPQRTQAMPPAGESAAEHDAAVAAANRRAAQRLEKADRQSQAELQAGIAAEAERERAQRAAVAAAGQRSAQRQEKAEQQARSQAIAEAEQARDQQAAVAAASRRSAERGEKAARQLSTPATPAAAPPPPPPSPVIDVAEARPSDVYQEPSPPAPPQPVADIGAFVETAKPAVQADGRLTGAGFVRDPGIVAAASASDTSAVATANVIDEDARLPATQWLQRIRLRSERGEVALARASLERFVHEHPQEPVPADLRALLP